MQVYCPELNKNIRLNTHVLDYLGPGDNHTAWSARGLKGHDGAAEQAYKSTFSSAQQLLADLPRAEAEKIQQKTADFLQRTIEIYRSLKQNPKKYLRNFLADRQFYLICGFYRSGGTYLLTHVLRAFNQPISSYNRGMIHDGCPNKSHIPATLSPVESDEFLLEFSQWLAWAEERFKDEAYIVKKSTALGKIVSWLATIFQDQLTVLFHYRHPFPTLLSYYDYRGKTLQSDSNKLLSPSADLNNYLQGFTRGLIRLPQNRYNKLNPLTKLTLSWIVYHSTILQDFKALEKNCHFKWLKFGPALEQFVRQFIQNNGKQGKVEKFAPRQRTIPRDFFKQPIVKQLDHLRDRWTMLGISFPDP